jgi:uncharacterized membrane protein
MTVGETVQKAPNWILVVCGTVFGLAVLASITAITLAGKDADDLIRVINAVLNVLGIVAGAGAWISAGAAGRSASNVEQKIDDVTTTGDINRG